MFLLILFLVVNVGFSHWVAKRQYRLAALAHLVFFLTFSFLLLMYGMYPTAHAVIDKCLGVGGGSEIVAEALDSTIGFFSPITFATLVIFVQTALMFLEVTTTSIIHIIRRGQEIWNQTRKRTVCKRTAVVSTGYPPRTKLCYVLCVMLC